MIEINHQYINEILKAYQQVLGNQFESYRNHVYRVYNLTLLLSNSSLINKEEIAVAAAFHDLGIWTNKTLDYLAPSITLAKEFALEKGIKTDEIENMILYHHKILRYASSKVVDNFRKADLADVTFGFINFGVNRRTIKELTTLFPNLGFQRFVLKVILRYIVRHPLNPLPILKV